MAVVMALVLFTLVIFMAFATNMGILVNDRIRMQNAVDLGAYSGAHSQAQALNELAYLNDKIIVELYKCRKVLEDQYPIQGDPCQCTPPTNQLAEDWIRSCEDIVGDLAAQFRTAASYSETTSKAMNAARATMNANLANLAALANADTHFFDTTQGSATRPSAYSNNRIANFEQMTTTLHYLVAPSCPCAFGCCTYPPVPSPEHNILSYYVKDELEPTVWFMAQGAGTMDIPYLDIDYNGSGNDGGYFGGSSAGGLDKMYATAVAKPYDGSVGPTRQYIQDGRVSNGIAGGQDPDSQFSGVWRSKALRDMREFMQPTYRARLAGINEWRELGNSVPNNPILAISNNNRSGGYNDASKMLH
jgi:hypothetical protein